MTNYKDDSNPSSKIKDFLTSNWVVGGGPADRWVKLTPTSNDQAGLYPNVELNHYLNEYQMIYARKAMPVEVKACLISSVIDRGIGD